MIKHFWAPSPYTLLRQLTHLHKGALVYFSGLAFIFFCVYSSVSVSSSETDIKSIWSLDSVFTQPESAVFDAVSNAIYISNVNGYAKDGNGFVSKVSLDGQTVELDWLTGINSPTGVTVVGRSLFVVDYDELLEVDIRSASIVGRFAAPDPKPALNDVVADSDGNIFVTGSLSNTIYVLGKTSLEVWLQDDENLVNANGLFIDQGKLVLGGAKLLFIDRVSKAILATGPAELNDIDGISSDGCGGLIVTLINDQRLWRLRVSGEAQPLNEWAIDGIDLSFFEGDLFVPRVGGTLSRYQVRPSFCDLD